MYWQECVRAWRSRKLVEDYVNWGTRILQSLLSTFLAVLVYLSSMIGLTPAADRSGSALAPALQNSGPQAPAPSGPSVSYPGATEVMGYYAERFSGDPGAYASLQEAARSLTSVAAFSYRVDAAGRISGALNRRMFGLARARGLKVLALVHNAGKGDFDPGVAHLMLNNPLARQRAIDELVNLLVQNGLDGVNLDLEGIPAGDRALFTAFVRDLSMRLRPRHFLVTASLPAKTGDDPGSSWSGAYDYRALSPYLDQVVLMTYDEHVAGGHPGPVASLAWVDSVVRYTVTAFPRQKIIIGIPAYGYVWSARGDKAITFNQAASLIRRYGITPTWDYTAQVPYFQYKQSGTSYRVWYENNRSAAAKAALVRRYGLRGVAVWRLGYEDPALWNSLAAKLA